VNSWAKDASRASMCINAKAETVDKLPSFREAFAKRRCVVPADGFYEWRGPKARREPLWIHPAAAPYSSSPDSSRHGSSSPASADDVHHLSRRPPTERSSRLPVILDEAGAEWSGARSALAQAPAGAGTG
jgi:hypothetical protein